MARAAGKRPLRALFAPGLLPGRGALGLALCHVGQRVLAGEVDAALLVDLGDLHQQLVAHGDHILDPFDPLGIQLLSLIHI